MTEAFWESRRVFLTGHTGFKGAWCALWLQRLGAEVLGYSLPPPTEPSLFELAKVGAGMETVIGDIRERARLTETVRRFGPEVIIHFAAQPLVRESYENPFGTYEINVLGTVCILEAARQCDRTRGIVVVTSDKCYENHDTGAAYRETDPLGGRDPYSNSKSCAELVTASYRESFLAARRLGVATARAGNVVGGGDWAKDRLVPDLMRAFREGRSALVRNPASTRPWQHVLDPLSGYMMLAEALTDGRPVAEPWNFGPSEECVRPVSVLADVVSRLWGEGARWHHEPVAQPHEAAQLALDAAKARQRLNWKPRLDHQSALEWTVEWYKAHARGSDLRALTLEQIERYGRLRP
ncbi:MAG: CDP-glucose 4,6-dehydratase [Deltaproteobacteria bacterium]